MEQSQEEKKQQFLAELEKARERDRVLQQLRSNQKKRK